MRSLRAKLVLSFLGVALVAVGVLGLLVGRATGGAFEDYLIGRQTGGSGAGSMIEEMMGSRAGRAMLEQMVGPAERAYLASVNDAVWLAAGIAVLAAVALGLLLARQISGPVRDLTSAARRMAAGDYEGRVPVGTDDEIGELAAAFNAMAGAVGRQEALRRRMAADIAHELRTPLAVVQADLEAMLDGVRPLSAGALEEVHEETRLLSRLIDDLRDLSLAETGGLPLHETATDLGALARASATRFVPRAQEKEVRLGVEGADEPSTVQADADRISQVLGNLLENALRHVPKGGVITVRLVARPDGAGVTVHNTGRGIPEEHLPNLFERFYRADPARSRTNGGSGIGLAVVKQLVEAHGGRVWAESPPEGGATFGFTLPSARARSRDGRTEAHRGQGGPRTTSNTTPG